MLQCLGPMRQKRHMNFSAYEISIKFSSNVYIYIYIYIFDGGLKGYIDIDINARGVMVFVLGIRHSDQSLNPPRDCLLST